MDLDTIKSKFIQALVGYNLEHIEYSDTPLPQVRGIVTRGDMTYAFQFNPSEELFEHVDWIALVADRTKRQLDTEYER